MLSFADDPQVASQSPRVVAASHLSMLLTPVFFALSALCSQLDRVAGSRRGGKRGSAGGAGEMDGDGRTGRADRTDRRTACLQRGQEHASPYSTAVLSFF